MVVPGRRGIVRRRPRLERDLLLLSILALVIALDQLSKRLVVSSMVLGESIPAEGLVRLTYVTNSGGAFGILNGQILFLTVASFVGIAVLLLFYRTHPWPGRLVRLSLGLQLGGAVGNLIDRVRVGEVVDFIDVGPWPIFNLADSSIVIGISLLMGLLLFSSGRERRHSPARSLFLTSPALGALSLPVGPGGPWGRPPPEVGC